ncbi:hypothetical protein K493DRAFT_315001 [Basidiobolus meristosporus CBS 931.73]|uniref:Rhodanese domain-containing protein n=1 Tax=Basidiobolus meristosporus CBS 931.73 TaxID=1314790 RepID=A0A1Y1YCT7_9FUNG|nr:hypothetical protein K493DRAFT_315001 [Basidiobolus meristosporus CBS 931.73]|eukprot:ORX95424.1 hypothetical protein K493DRAFT_315001 [Basidiobolus meristosporus CBS 931.73]
MSEGVKRSLEKCLGDLVVPRILDLRSEEEFRAKRIKNSTNIPYEELARRWFELPHRRNPFIILLPKDLHGIPDRLQEWTITEAFANTPEFWAAAEELGVVAEGPERSVNLLFSPCPFLEENIEEIEDRLVKGTRSETLSCCDVGCGSGRDVAWLCSRSKVSWSAHAADSWLGSLNRTRQLANSLNLSEKVTTCGARFTSEGTVKSVDSSKSEYTHEGASFLDKQFDLVICIRFLERSSFSIIDKLVAPGGILLYSTFVDGVIEFDKPSGKNHRLELGELKEYFGHYTILHDRIEYIEDGRPVNSFLAQKPQH